jgi:hypothetical protein
LSDRHVTVAHAIATGKRRKIAQVRDGEDRVIVGRVASWRTTLNAPLSGEECVHYRIAVEGPTPRTQTSTLLERAQGVEFVVEDDSGRALVSCDDAKVSLHKDSAKLTPQVRDYVLALEAPELEGVSLSELRILEGCLVPGETVAVRGRCRWEPDPDGAHGGSYREQPRRLRIGAPLFISDRAFGNVRQQDSRAAAGAGGSAGDAEEATPPSVAS